MFHCADDILFIERLTHPHKAQCGVYATVVPSRYGTLQPRSFTPQRAMAMDSQQDAAAAKPESCLSYFAHFPPHSHGRVSRCADGVIDTIVSLTHNMTGSPADTLLCNTYACLLLDFAHRKL